MEILFGLLKIIFVIIFLLLCIVVILLIYKNFINKNNGKKETENNPLKNHDQVRKLASTIQSYRDKIEEQENEIKTLSNKLKELEKKEISYQNLIKNIIDTQRTILEKNDIINSNFINYYLEKRIKSISLSLFMISIVLKPNYNKINLLKEIDDIILIANSQYQAEEFINRVYELGKLISQYCKNVLNVNNEQEIAVILTEIANIIIQKCYSISLYVPKPNFAHFDINTMETNNLKQGQVVNKIITWGVTIDNIEYKPFVR